MNVQFGNTKDMCYNIQGYNNNGRISPCNYMVLLRFRTVEEKNAWKREMYKLQIQGREFHDSQAYLADCVLAIHRFRDKWGEQACPFDMRLVLHDMEARMGRPLTDFGHDHGHFFETMEEFHGLCNKAPFVYVSRRDQEIQEA